MPRLNLVVATLSLPLLLVGCNPSTRTAGADVAPIPASAATATTAMPAGAGCAASVNRFKTLIDTDLATGHTTKSVHAQVSQEISAAAQLCSAGNDAGARAAITASRSRHGYPAG